MKGLDYLNKMKADELLDNIFYTSLLIYKRHDGKKCEKCNIVQGKPHNGFKKYYCKHLENKINRKLKKYNDRALELTIGVVMKNLKPSQKTETGGKE